MDEKERIEKVMESEGLSSSIFAAEIGIQGSTLSHILNGRNNPSLDVLKKVLNRFRTISSDWLILGIGSMYRNSAQSHQGTLFDIKPEIINNAPEPYIQKETQENKVDCIENRNSEVKTTNSPIVQAIVPMEKEKSISKIVVFYSDGTFEELSKI